jgi:hypothetical protein
MKDFNTTETKHIGTGIQDGNRTRPKRKEDKETSFQEEIRDGRFQQQHQDLGTPIEAQEVFTCDSQLSEEENETSFQEEIQDERFQQHRDLGTPIGHQEVFSYDPQVSGLQRENGCKVPRS